MFCSLLFVACNAPSEPIYKSIDRHGNISYAAAPTLNAVAVERIVPLPAPSEKEVRRAEEALEEYRIQTEKERQEYLEWKKEQIRMYQAMMAYRAIVEAYQPPSPPPPKQIVYPAYYYPYHPPYCPYCPELYPDLHPWKHRRHSHKAPPPHRRKLQPDRRRSLLPPHRKAQVPYPHIKQSHRGHHTFSHHQSFSSDSIFLPAKGPAQ